MSGHYVLDANGEPVLCLDVLAWARWLEAHRDVRKVARTQIGETVISTVFLGLDHNFFGGQPILWETMIFGGPHDEWQKRYTSRQEAFDDHQRIIRALQTGKNPGESVDPDPATGRRITL